MRAEPRVTNGRPARKMSRLAFVGWAILAVNALGTGLIALRYALPHVPFPTPLPNFYVRHGWLLVNHVPFTTAYPSVAWLCWMPNLALAEWMVWRRRPRVVLQRSFVETGAESV
jgi:hypothetical protein